jgi:hypothetical protein
MNTARHAIALAGIAAGAHAQTVGTISFNAPAQLNFGEVFTVEVIASGDQNGILSFNLAITMTNLSLVGTPIGNSSLFTFNTFDGVGDFEASGGANAFGKQQLPNGSVLFSFQAILDPGANGAAIDASPGTIDGGGGGTLTYGTDVGFFLLPTDFDIVRFQSPFFPPAPGSLAPVALGGLYAARRRRAS